VTLDEPGVVALRGAVRPGAARAFSGRTPGYRHPRATIGFPSVVLAFHRPGTLVVNLRLTKAARRTLNRSRDARLTVPLVAADGARNQVTATPTRTMRR
jgi:hypothetical protein